jgi:hypothetical protein
VRYGEFGRAGILHGQHAFLWNSKMEAGGNYIKVEGLGLGLGQEGLLSKD